MTMPKKCSSARTPDGKTGVLEEANGGVLFINGLEDLPASAQRLLLAALGDDSVHSAGAGRAPQRFDVRILSSAQPGFETRGPSHSASTCFRT